MTEDAGLIARDLVAEVGRAPALGYMLGASTLRRAWRSLQLTVAVLFASER